MCLPDVFTSGLGIRYMVTNSDDDCLFIYLFTCLTTGGAGRMNIPTSYPLRKDYVK